MLAFATKAGRGLCVSITHVKPLAKPAPDMERVSRQVIPMPSAFVMMATPAILAKKLVTAFALESFHIVAPEALREL